VAKWYRENLAERTIHTGLMDVAEQMRAALGDASEIGPGSEAPEWMKECFDRYLGLLDGAFRCTETQPQNEDSSQQIRVYHSGSILM